MWTQSQSKVEVLMQIITVDLAMICHFYRYRGELSGLTQAVGKLNVFCRLIESNNSK